VENATAEGAADDVKLIKIAHQTDNYWLNENSVLLQFVFRAQIY